MNFDFEFICEGNTLENSFMQIIPQKGIVFAHSETKIDFVFEPKNLSTSICEIVFFLNEFNFKPIQVSFYTMINS